MYKLINFEDNSVIITDEDNLRRYMEMFDGKEKVKIIDKPSFSIDVNYANSSINICIDK